MDFRKDINGIRAIAVLSVLFFHFGAKIFSGGFIGVDVFFVISGFLMSKIIFTGLDRGDFTVRKFLWARVVRLYPALLTVILLVFVFGFFFVEAVAFKELAYHGLASLLFYSNLDYASEAGYFDSSSGLKWFLHTWSLSVEWQFYILYSLVLVSLRRFIKPGLPRILFLSSALLFSLAVALVCALHQGSPKAAALGFYSLPSRAYEMLIGGLLAIIPDARHFFSGLVRRAFESLGLILITMALFLFDPLTPWPAAYALIPCLATALVIFAAAEGSLLSYKFLQFFGNISYSLYLWHWPIAVALHYWNLEEWEWKVSGLLLSVILGWLSYAWIENPARVYFRRVGMSMHGVYIMAACAVGVIGLLATLNDNLPKLPRSEELLFADAKLAGGDRDYPIGECGGFSRGRLRPCIVGEVATADTVVLGDSFAEMWYARTQYLERTHGLPHGVVYLTYGGCPPISDVDRREGGFNCADFHRAALRYITSQGRFKKVILVSMWTAYFDQDKVNTVIREGSREFPLGTDEGFRRAMANLERDISLFRAAGIEVYISLTSPYPSFDVASRIRKAILNGEPVDRVEFNFSQVASQAMPIDEAICKLASPQVIVINLGRNFCADEICMAAIGGKAIYSDGAHMRSSVLREQPSALDSIFLDDIQTPPR